MRRLASKRRDNASLRHGRRTEICAFNPAWKPDRSISLRSFSAYTLVIADVASSPGGGRRTMRADARRPHAGRAAHSMAGRNARIGVCCEMTRGHSARASHGGSCEHGRGDQRSRKTSGFDHFFLHLADPLSGWPDNQTCIRPSIFPGASAVFQIPDHDCATRGLIGPARYALRCQLQLLLHFAPRYSSGGSRPE